MVDTFMGYSVFNNKDGEQPFLTRNFWDGRARVTPVGGMLNAFKMSVGQLKWKTSLGRLRRSCELRIKRSLWK